MFTSTQYSVQGFFDARKFKKSVEDSLKDYRKFLSRGFSLPSNSRIKLQLRPNDSEMKTDKA